MNRLTRIFAIVLMLLAAALAALAWWLGHRPPSPALTSIVAPQTATYPSIVAARKLVEGNPITATDIKLVVMPTMAPGAFRDIGSVIGEIPLVDIPQDAVITRNNLAHGLATKLEPGQRAVAIAVDEVIGVGNKIEAGDYVDVFFTLRRGDETEKGQSRLLASRWQVLAYGSAVAGQMTADGNAPAHGQTQQQQQQPGPQARSAVLAAPVDQINALLLAAQNGKITLALRHPADDGVANTTLFAEPQTILHGKSDLSATQKATLNTPDNRAFSGVGIASWSGATTPAGALPGKRGNRGPAQETLEVIRGTQRENMQY